MPQNADVRSTAGHCINVTLSYTFVSGPHGPAAGKFFNRVQQFSLLTDRILAGQEVLENIWSL
nr:hypothetical protein [Escherichia coli]